MLRNSDDVHKGPPGAGRCYRGVGFAARGADFRRGTGLYLRPGAVTQSPAPQRRPSRPGSLSLDELNDRIAITRDNIRQLIEQAAAMSGAGDEARNADRLAEQQAELDTLVKQRDALLKNRGKPAR